MRRTSLAALLFPTSALAAEITVDPQAAEGPTRVEEVVPFLQDGDVLVLAPGEHGAIIIDKPVQVSIHAKRGARVAGLQVRDGGANVRALGLHISGVPQAVEVAAGSLVLEGATLEAGGHPATGYAVAVRPDAEATLRGVTVREFTGANGVVIANAGAGLTIEESRFEDNAATRGGAIYAEGAKVSITASAFSGNRAGEAGGAIVALGGRLSLREVAASDNVAPHGGAIFAGPGTELDAMDIHFEDNTAAEGGHLLLDGATARLIRGELRAGQAATGAGIALRDGALTGMNLLFVDSYASGSGGAIWQGGGQATLGYSVLHRVGAGIGGGYAASAGSALLRGVIVMDAQGDGLACAGSAGLRFEEGVLWDNDGDREGGLSGCATAGEQVHVTDPRFVDARGGVYALRGGSAAIDIGVAGEADRDDTAADAGIYGGAHATALSDRDGDGFAFGRDCDDLDGSINERAADAPYDGIDSNCDGASDFDQDGDGQDAMQFGGTDCVDTDPTIYTGAAESDGDKLDVNCDGPADPDRDGDGWTASLDCDDSLDAVYPGAPDAWYDGVDSNCDAAADFDRDGDGWDSIEHGGTDCNDLDGFVHPGMAEIAGDTVDQDCDGFDATRRADDGAPARSTTEAAPLADAPAAEASPDTERASGVVALGCSTAAGGNAAPTAIVALMGLAIVLRRRRA